MKLMVPIRKNDIWSLQTILLTLPFLFFCWQKLVFVFSSTTTMTGECMCGCKVCSKLLSGALYLKCFTNVGKYCLLKICFLCVLFFLVRWGFWLHFVCFCCKWATFLISQTEPSVHRRRTPWELKWTSMELLPKLLCLSLFSFYGCWFLLWVNVAAMCDV